MGKLTIYKASAGSGKTFKLAAEYIKIVVLNPENYKRTLAVTFTNKATEEMKYRIITHLNGIANALPDSEDYFKAVASEVGLPEVVIRERARQALSLLIHNYHFFRIETIDSFFQRIVRNLSHELQLTNNLRIELNDKQIEQNAVDTMIDNMNTNDQLLGWIIGFINERINDDKNWNIIKQLKRFGENIFKQPYKQNAKQLENIFANDDKFDNYKREITRLAHNQHDILKNRADYFFRILNENGLGVDDIAKKERGICGYFLKLRDGKIGNDYHKNQEVIQKHIDNPALWSTKKHKRSEFIINLAETTLCSLLNETEKKRKEIACTILSCNITLRHLNELRLLKHITHEIAKSNQQNGRFLLSDTQDLLHSMIDDSDAPFIYEKIGARIEQIMIDEFQDTSSVQWHNFKVLLNECISNDASTNLIVGDVKQSIYRWRDGDWQLLNNIEKEFPNQNGQIQSIPLNINWRSTKKIIDFNSLFFQEASNIEYKSLTSSNNENAHLINEAYRKESVKQINPPKVKEGGFIDVALLPKDDYETNTLLHVKQTIDILLENGAEGKDIAILARTNKHISLIADYLLKQFSNITIVSDEAFTLGASPAVCLIVKIIHYVCHPDDLLARIYIAKMYQNHILANNIADQEITLSVDCLNAHLPEWFDDEIEHISQMSIYEMAEYIYRVFNIDRIEKQSSYICTFFDELLNYLNEYIADADSFLKAWDENISKKAVQITDSEGIRILSIHRSKGLEFDHVIVPFCDWDDGLQGDTLWASTNEMPYAKLPIIPVAYYPNQLENSAYKHSFHKEQLQRTIDNLNLLYVAFTRAGRSLIIIGKNEKNNKRSNLIKNTLNNIYQSLDNSQLEESEEMTKFTWGKISCPKHKSKAVSSNIFTKVKHAVQLTSTTAEPITSFRQSNESRKFLNSDSNLYIDNGNLLHQMLSEIKYIDDIEKTIKRYEQEGLLNESTMKASKIKQILEDNLNSPTIRQWFDKNNEVLNEQTIIVRNENNEKSEFRPDRIIRRGDAVTIVDYKFAKAQETHQHQVANYMQLFRNMGYNNVKGYIWYVFKRNIAEVNS